jgi:hypothetical protein
MSIRAVASLTVSAGPDHHLMPASPPGNQQRIIWVIDEFHTRPPDQRPVVCRRGQSHERGGELLPCAPACSWTATPRGSAMAWARAAPDEAGAPGDPGSRGTRIDYYTLTLRNAPSPRSSLAHQGNVDLYVNTDRADQLRDLRGAMTNIAPQHEYFHPALLPFIPTRHESRHQRRGDFVS